jgi:hypothetical protein
VDALQQQVKALEQQLAAAAVNGQRSQPLLVKAVADAAVQAGGTDRPAQQLQSAGLVAGHKREASLGDWTHLHMGPHGSGGGSSSGSMLGACDRGSLTGQASASGAQGDTGSIQQQQQQQQQQAGDPVELRPLGVGNSSGSSSNSSSRGLGLSRSARGFDGPAAAAEAAAAAAAAAAGGEVLGGVQAAPLAAAAAAAGGASPAAHGLTLSPVRPSISVPAPSPTSTPPGTPVLTPTAAAAAAAGGGTEFSEAGAAGASAKAMPAAAPSAAAGGVGEGVGDSSASAATAAATSSSSGSGMLSGSPVLSWTGAHLSARRSGAPGGFYPGTSPPSRSYLSGFEQAPRSLSNQSSRRGRSSTDDSSGLPSGGASAGGVGGAGTSGGGAAADQAGWVPEAVLPVAASLPAEVVQPLQALTAGLTACAWSPSGDNVATACADGSVGVWCAPGVSGNAGRVANISSGVAVTSLCWDGRADKVMLLGCSGGAGVRVWHADQRRILEQVTVDTSYPVVTAVATCPSEPCFVVAAAATSAGAAAGAATAAGAQGCLTIYNSRSFKRTAVYSIPGEPSLYSLAYNRSGTVLAAGSTTGRVYLLDPGGRASPLKAWSVLPRSSTVTPDWSDAAAVQVAWRPVQSAAAAAAAAAAGMGSGGATTAAVVVGSPSSSSGTLLTGSSSTSETLLTCCRGVLAEWGVGSSSSSSNTWPLAAVDVAGAAAAALSGAYLQTSAAGGSDTQPPEQQQQQQQQQQQTGEGVLTTSDVQPAGITSCAFGLSSDGRWCAVVCGAAERGCVLMYDLQVPVSPDQVTSDTGAAAGASRSGLGRVPPVVLLVTEALAGPRVVIDWRPGQGLVTQPGGSSSGSSSTGGGGTGGASAAPAAEGSGGGTHVLLVGGSKGVAITLKVQL